MDDVDGSRSDVAAGALVATASLALLVGSISWRGQHAARSWWAAQGIADGLELESLPLHTAAMTGTGLIAIAAAVLLVTRGRVALAVAALIGAVAGPMTLVAAPLSESFLRDDDSYDTTYTWHLVVGAALAGLLATGTWWTSRRLGHAGVLSDHETSGGPPRSLSDSSLFVIVAGVCLTAQVPMMGNPERPALVVATGWALLVAGCTVAGTSLNGWQTGLATLSCAAVLLLMALAYLRIGGWPGVAGWELLGQPPVILTSVSAVSFAAGPVLGFLTTVPRRRAAHLSSQTA
ncbi:hypothetical protein [Kineosporia sp. NBRC 101731]|uniref:hypothetical protein n=1 Tax=Kineosporia sp. NBRC 101731 TaxID=3032199 RepID=UPI0024A0DE42|nr:hypothetical protein [Kineosporia sp. NBRC 101731]GLY29000.1 hypothetical protein Kisp02_23650 [Kineosporia sp. NBRC 101731]